MNRRVLKQTYVFKIGGNQSQSFCIWNATKRKTYLEIKFESRDIGVLQNEGELSHDGKLLILTRTRIDPKTGNPTSISAITTFQD